VQSATCCSDVPAGHTRRNGHGLMAPGMETNWYLGKPPHASRYSIKLAYVRAYPTDMAYTTLPGQEETPRYFGRRQYTKLHTMAMAGSTIRDIHVMTMHPTLTWPQIWLNLQTAWFPDDVTSAWFMAIHDIIPTNDRLFKIHLADTNRCNHCAQTDALSPV